MKAQDLFRHGYYKPVYEPIIKPSKKRDPSRPYIKIEHGYISSSVGHFRSAFFEKFGLKEQGRSAYPCVMFGMYNVIDWHFSQLHRHPLIVVWCGNDSKKITPLRQRMLLVKRKIKHIATSQVISRDLEFMGIPHEVLPVSPAAMDIEPYERGESIYCYYGMETKKKFYGVPLANEVEKRTGLKVIYAAHDTFTRSQLMDVYRDCFVGLRLTPRDGVSVTAVELGMMGRRVIFNGDTPSAIPWKGIDDICQSVQKEYNNRHIDDTAEVSKQVKEYLDIGTEWLKIY